MRRYRDRHAVAFDAAVRAVSQRFPDLAMHRVLANLIDSALAYGHEPITVAARQADGDLHILVRDGGPGIALRDLGGRVIDEAFDGWGSAVGVAVPVGPAISAAMTGRAARRPQVVSAPATYQGVCRRQAPLNPLLCTCAFS